MSPFPDGYIKLLLIALLLVTAIIAFSLLLY